MSHISYRRESVLLLIASVLVAGCNRTQAQPEAPPPPEVMISLPVTRTVTDFEEFPGRIDAVRMVEVRCRVTGYLEKVLFTEGAEVKEGQVLFLIDARPYQATLAAADANLVQAQVHLNRLEADYRRASTLVAKGAIGQEDFDKVAGDRAEAAASVGVAKANRHTASLNLDFTQVKSPINGRISRRLMDPGNLVKADDTPLTTIVSQDPVYANFDLDERTTLRLQELLRQRKMHWSRYLGDPVFDFQVVQGLLRDGRLNWSREGGLPVLLGLANEESVSRVGLVNFADNRIDADSGTWRMRGVFPNADHVLSPGMFVRLRLLIGTPYPAAMVAEQALGTDQGQKFVYVVDDNNIVAYRRVKVGRMQNGLRVILDGLKMNEKVVVSGLQRVRPKAPVTPKLVPMPEPKSSKAQG